MKKSLPVFIFVLAAVTLTAAEYTFTALGDIHFDGKEYHNVPAATKNRKKERLQSKTANLTQNYDFRL